MSSTGIGEPVITPGKIQLPVRVPKGQEKKEGKVVEIVAWDMNMLSFDGYSPETGWVKMDTKRLASVHISSFEKRRSMQRKAKSKRARSVLVKNDRRERNRAIKHQVEVARMIRVLSNRRGVESLRKEAVHSFHDMDP